MLQNYLKIAIRNLFKHKAYSAINIVGLGLGLASSLFIYLWILDETSINQFHANKDRIYQVFTNMGNSGTIMTWGTSPGPLADLIRDEVPEVELATRVTNRSTLFSVGDTHLMGKGALADTSFFKIFSFPLLEGDAQNPIPGLTGLALSESFAQRLFPEGDAMGKMIRVSRQYDLMVTSIYKDIPSASTLQYEFIMPFAIQIKEDGDNFNWSNFNFTTYYLVNTAAKSENVAQKINEALVKVMPEVAEEDGSVPDLFYGQLFSENYLNGHFENGRPDGGRILYVQIFILIGIFILVLACINFMNLSTARSAMRAKEVGVRKSIGANRSSLVGQFLGESFLITALAMGLALVAVQNLLPLFNTVMQKQISLPWTSVSFVIGLLSIVLVTALLAGSYPAMILSGFKPLEVLKGSMLNNMKGVNLRRALVVFQFALSGVLLLGMGIVYKQMNYINSKHLGYEKDQVLVFSGTGPLNRSYVQVKHDLENLPEIEVISRANTNLMPVENSTSSVSWQGKPDNESMYFRAVVADNDFIEAAGFTLIEGRGFNTQQNDTGQFVITRSMAKIMNKENVIGEPISLWGQEGTVVGVIEDFHSRSMQESIDPIVIMNQPNWVGTYFVRFKGENTAAMLAGLEEVYKKYESEVPLRYQFLDDEFGRLYKSESTLSTLSIVFTGMAVFISCLGLFGLASFMAERKTREIGIRKVLGASVAQIILLLCKDFVLLVVVAFAVAAPVAYFAGAGFLEKYAYRTELSAWLFVASGVLMVLIALLTVSIQSYRAASADPVKAIKSE
ncbi:ABC transporter permease [Cytophagales bacterium LB-30]|uniref:ABC transporter permease n=1 Tax=Shiella aurantiaca TaxID=3058365 RepID=A0ABT8F3P1_9BACT|nr:ABC transporter permease [Shiella aurantiaca]MDN4165075.1 ABC transporter permease [Shiella aurantiaca]